ncbi:thiocillin family RiPP [Nonomuraea sediminis]|uniref:thiocillin family RiPP n=1 Tax=Nonomuraea sediminis TaxID=2835864 RepID=UPI001BDBE3CC|nr:thiocillin family RiPP [Nonomuraea sediminis]
MTHDNHDIELTAIELPAGGLEIEQLDEAAALGTFGTSSTVSTGSCPFSSAMTVMCASSSS